MGVNIVPFIAECCVVVQYAVFVLIADNQVSCSLSSCTRLAVFHCWCLMFCATRMVCHNDC